MLKAFLIHHGEKLFVLVVALVAGWSLFTSLKSLGASDVLPKADTEDIRKIAKELDTKVAPPKVAAPYGEWLQANLDGHGIYALAVGAVRSPLVYEPPSMAKGPGTQVEEVPGRIGLPGGLSAVPGRGKVTFSWTVPTVTDMSVSLCDVLRREEGGEWGAKPVYSGAGTSFVDKDVKPETVYAYKVRAAGVPAPAKENTIVKPEGLSRVGDLWYTAFAGGNGRVSAMTPSNIDFECKGTMIRFGTEYARIIVKRWNNMKEKWDDFTTEYEQDDGDRKYGVAVGEKVIGQEILDPRDGIITPETPREIFDSGYVVKEIKKEIGTKKVPQRYIKPDGTWGERWVDVGMVIHEVILVNPAKNSTVTVPVGKGKTKIKKTQEDKPKDTKPGSPGGDIGDLRALFESRGGPSKPKKDAVTGPESAGAPAAGNPGATVKLVLPEGWSPTEELAELGIGVVGVAYLGEGKVTVHKGPTANSGVVVGDRFFDGGSYDGEDMRKLRRGQGDLAGSAEKQASFLATNLLARAKEAFQGLTTKSSPKTVTTAAGNTVGTFAFVYSEGQEKVAVMRYGAFAPLQLYTLSFVCREKDYEKLRGAFEKIATSWTW